MKHQKKSLLTSISTTSIQHCFWVETLNAVSCESWEVRATVAERQETPNQKCGMRMPISIDMTSANARAYVQYSWLKISDSFKKKTSSPCSTSTDSSHWSCRRQCPAGRLRSIEISNSWSQDPSMKVLFKMKNPCDQSESSRSHQFMTYPMRGNTLLQYIYSSGHHQSYYCCDFHFIDHKTDRWGATIY
jgi:hypothetical protein